MAEILLTPETIYNNFEGQDAYGRKEQPGRQQHKTEIGCRRSNLMRC